MRPDERLRAVLAGKAVDRPPVVKPGFLSFSLPGDMPLPAGFEIEKAGRDGAALADLCEFVQRETGVECLALPFTMTMESEAYGGETEEAIGGPVYRGTPLKSVRDLGSLKKLDPATDGRLPVVLDAVRRLSKNTDRLPVIGELVGPLSLATSLVDGWELLKSLVKDPEGAGALLDFLAEGSVRFLRALAGAGSDVIAVTEPAVTSATFGSELFRRFSLPYLNRITGAAHALGVPVIIHLCAAPDLPIGSLKELGAECLSVDQSDSIAALKDELPCRIMGGVSAVALSDEATDRVRREVREAALAGVDIIAPACGLGPGVKAANMKVLVEAGEAGVSGAGARGW